MNSSSYAEQREPPKGSTKRECIPLLPLNSLRSIPASLSARPPAAPISRTVDALEATPQDLVLAVKEDYRVRLENVSWTQGDGVEALAAEHQPWARSVLAQTSDLAARFDEVPPENAVIVGQPFPRFRILVSSEGHLLGGQLEYRQKGGEAVDKCAYPDEETARAAGVDLEADVQWHTYPPQFFDRMAQPLPGPTSHWEWCGY